MSDLSHLGWSGDLAEAFLPHAAAGLAPARVVRVDRSGYELLAVDGPCRATASAPVLGADEAAAVTVGDWVAVRRWADGPRTVEAVLPRRSVLVRRTAGRAATAQVLAANVDVVLVVHGLSVVPPLGRVERLLALAWESGARPAVVLTKSDLAPDAAEVRDDVAAAAPGVEVLVCSAVTGDGLDAVRGLLPAGVTGVLVGPSGAGKSTLLNALVGQALMDVRPPRADGKGRHTTAYRSLVGVPGGGVLVDGPGMRGVPLWEAAQGLDATFAEVVALGERCRFRDCRHGGEPGCAVAAAMDEGTLPARRLDSWRKLQRELAWLEARRDARLGAEARRARRRQARAMRDRGYR